MVLFAPVLDGVPFDKQRETVAERAKNGASARHFREQPVRHWDHWLHQNADMANVHVIASTAFGKDRVDLTPEARRELSIEPEFDIATDGTRVAVTWQTTGADRERDTVVRVIDVATGGFQAYGGAANTNNDSPKLSPDGRTLAVDSQHPLAARTSCARR